MDSIILTSETEITSRKCVPPLESPTDQLIVGSATKITVTTPPDTPTVGEAILHFINLESNNDEIVYLFGVPGGGIMHLLNLIKDQKEKFKYIICRQETGAAFMADGYYRATGKLGVVLVTTGPGATNALTGVMNANNDGSAMILISGEVDQTFMGKGYLQEGEDSKISINSIFTAATTYSTILNSPLSAVSQLKQAFRDIFVLPSQAVHISLPDNVTSMQLPVNYLPASTDSYRAKQHYVNMEDVIEVLKVLRDAQRPLIMLGNGCRNAMNYHDDNFEKEGDHKGEDHLQQFIEFVEAWGIPVMTTPDGKGIFPERHDLSLRVFGVANCMWPFYWLTLGRTQPQGTLPAPVPPATTPYLPADQTPFDAIIVIGSSLGDLACSKYYANLMPSNGMFYQVDIAPEIIGRSYPVKKGIIAEAGAFINGLREKMDDKEYTPPEELVAARKNLIRDLKKNVSPFFSEAQYYSTATPIQPASVMRILDENLPPDQETHIFIDAGNCVGWANHYLAMNLKWNIYSSLSMGPMGFGVGAVVGGKLGRPNATNICITGDGAFMMQGSEVSTAARYGLGAIWIVLNDNNLGMVSQGMATYFPDTKDPGVWSELYELGQPDIKKYSEGLGADAYTIDNFMDLKDVMKRALDGANNLHRPQVIVVNIDPSVIPPYYNPLYKIPQAK